MNEIEIKIDFTKGTLATKGIALITGDYASTMLKFTFDREDGTKIFEMKNPSDELVYVGEIINGEVLLTSKVDATTIHNNKTYTKYTKDDSIYWYQPTDNKLFTDEWVEVSTFNLEEYTKVQVNASLFSESGKYIFEVSLYKNDTKLTSTKGILPVKQEQVIVGDEIVEAYIPIFDQLMQDIAVTVSGLEEDVDNKLDQVDDKLDDVDDKLADVDTKMDEVDDTLEVVDGKIETIEGQIETATTLINQANNLDLDVSKTGKTATVTITKKDNTTKSENILDGKNMEFVWDGTKLGTRLEGESEYTYVDLQGIQGPVGPQGEPFKIKKTYSSVAEMNADFNNMQVGDYVMIASSVEVQDNAKLYTKTPTEWVFITDFSGATGIKGETGATPSISIGTVTSGDTPSVTRTGTDENPVLNFVLQKGETGETGATGQTGATGNGISNIQKTSTSGLVDTYTITYTDGTTTTYEVTNGEVTQEQLDEVIAENDYLNNVINQLPRVNGTGENITLDNTIEAKMKSKLSPSEMEQESYRGVNLCTSVSSSGTDLRFQFNRNYFDKTFTLSFTSNEALNGNTLYLDKSVGGSKSIGYISGSVNTRVSITTTIDDSVYTDLLSSTWWTLRIYKSGGDFAVPTDAQIENGSSMTDYEPYTGGNPAPNPDFPMDIHTTTGDNAIKVQNENLFDKNNVRNGYRLGSDGSYYEESGYSASEFIAVKPNTTYYRSLYISQMEPVCTYQKDGTFIARLTSVYLFTTPSNCYYIKTAMQNINLDTCMLNEGNSALPYVPHQEQTYPLTLGDLEYSKIGNYEDEFIYNTTDTNLQLNKWYLKKNVGKVVLDGSEDWIYQSANTRFVLNYTGAVNGGDLYCNHYIKGDTATTNNIIQMSANYIYIKDTRYSETNNYENWLSNNNTIVDYIRANPEYILLNDTLQEQLTNIYNNMMSKKTQTNISQVANDLPVIISASALLDLNTLVGN